MIATIALKEWRVLARSPLTWVASGVVQIVFAWLYLLALESWLQLQADIALNENNRGLTAWLINRCFAPASTLLMALTPLLTMRLIADERRSCGIELLLSAPIAPWQIALGKLLGAAGIYLLILAQLGLMVAVLLPFSAIDIGALLAAIFGLALFSTACCAIGLYFSALTRQAAVAALGAFGVLFLLWVAGITADGAGPSGRALAYLAIAGHLGSFLQGLVSSSDTLYFAILIAVFVTLTIRQIDDLRSVPQGAMGEWGRQISFVVALLVVAGLVAWMGERHPLRFDATAQSRHSLSQQSIETLQSMPEPLYIDAWLAPQASAERAVDNMVARYREYKSDIHLTFEDPLIQPSLAREKSIHHGGELILRYAGREQRSATLSERSLTHALVRLMRESQPQVRFVQGHLERQPHAETRSGFSNFTVYLRTLGFAIDPISLITEPAIPEDTDVLVVAAPSGDYFPGEVAGVLNFVANGGNVLWLLEPNQPVIPAELAAELGLSVLPGVIVDAASQQLAVDTPDFAVIDRYPKHPAIPDQLQVTLFPQAAGLEFPATVGWEVQPLLQTSLSSWNETGPLAGTINQDESAGEKPGPITLGAAFTRTRGTQEQRIAVVADADFLANGWLGNGGNKYLGQQLFNWLGSQRTLPAIAPLQAQDAQLIVAPRTVIGIGLTFLVLLPLIYFAMAFWTWRRRSR
ncbi:MAG: DUF4350 domain-containing protein [Pseudomonadota bacterium]